MRYLKFVLAFLMTSISGYYMFYFLPMTIDEDISFLKFIACAIIYVVNVNFLIYA